MPIWNYIDSGPNLGVYNMALDEELLARAQTGEGRAVLRLYAWNPPTVSLGRFQTRETNLTSWQCDGTLDLDSLSEADREFLLHFNVPVILAWGQAMLDWPSIEPADFICPALWLVGSEDQQAMDSVRKYEQCLKGSRIQLHIVEGLNHLQVFEKIDRVLPTMLAFTYS